MPEAIVTVSAPITGKRPPGTNWDAVDPVSYPVQSASLTWSWGSEPGQANVVYLSENPVQVGSALRLQIGQYHFAGICDSDVPLTSSRGNTRELAILDYRKWLAWDKCYCLFNQIEDRMVAGIRRRRYWHILPNNFNTMRRTWTTYPYTVADMCEFILKGPGIETPWTVAYVDAAGDVVPNSYHPNLAYPLYNVDALAGKPVGTWLTEVCQQCGLLFTLMSTPELPFNLVFGQKGVDGPDLTIPETADNIQAGHQLSGNPTRVRVLGDSNLYQVHDIFLVPDWNSNWLSAGFWDINTFTEFVFQQWGEWNAGTDPEQIVARQLALSTALEITVEQFDYACAAKGLTARGAWLDGRMYAGKCRNTMPAALYIQQVLLRCFRLPDGFWFRNTYGDAVYTDSIQVQDKMLAKVSHDPATGWTSWTLDEAPDGNCYVVVKGYQVGKDAFDSIKPERFNVTQWLSSQDIWQKIDARIEDSNDIYGPSIVFEEPVIRSEDLVTLVDGYAVFAAAPTITVPPVRATLTFSAEKFSWFQTVLIADPSQPPADPVMGTQTHDEVMNVGGLNGEFIHTPGAALYEIYYADEKSCRYKAIEFANNFLKAQWVHDKGSFTVPLDEAFAYRLHGKLDRVSLDHSPNGSIVSVSLTNERDRRNFVPERELDRMRQFLTLIPGQSELRRDSEAARKIAISAATSKDTYRLLTDAFKGVFTEQANARPVAVAAPSTGTVPIGAVYVGLPDETRPVLSTDATDDPHYFAGVTVRHNEAPHATSGGVIKLQTTGRALVRVKGPVAVNDSVVTVPASADAALVKAGGDGSTANSVAAGVALQAIEDTSVKLIIVNLGAAAQVDSSSAYKIVSHHDDHLVCHTFSGGVEGILYIYIAKPWELQFSAQTSSTWNGDEITYTYAMDASETQERTATGTCIPDGSEVQMIIRPYIVGDVIYASRVDYTGVELVDVPLTLMDENRGGRAWARKDVIDGA